MDTTLGKILVVISGLCWSLVYVDSIRTGFKQRTYCMPLFALGLNIAWEGIYAYYEVLGRGSVSVQGIANATWFLLDIALLATYFLFGKEECQSDFERRWHVPFGIVALACSLVLQVLFIFEFGDKNAEIYSAYLQNVAMSIAYLYMLRNRRSSRGQTRLIAICKWVGTLAPTLIGVIEANSFIVVTGIIFFVLDGLYLYFLTHVMRQEAKAAAAPGGICEG